MFGGGKFGIGQAIVAALNGYLAGTRGPGQQVGMNNLQMMAELHQRQLERQQALEDYNRQRTDSNADYITRLQEQAQYAPKEPHYFQDNSGNELAVGPDGQVQTVYTDPLPYKFVPNGMGGVVPVNLGALMHGGGGAAASPKPLTDADIERMSGGQTPPASVGFPGSR
jgi:hypothetical protein